MHDNFVITRDKLVTILLQCAAADHLLFQTLGSSLTIQAVLSLPKLPFNPRHHVEII